MTAAAVTMAAKKMLNRKRKRTHWKSVAETKMLCTRSQLFFCCSAHSRTIPMCRFLMAVAGVCVRACVCACICMCALLSQRKILNYEQSRNGRMGLLSSENYKQLYPVCSTLIKMFCRYTIFSRALHFAHCLFVCLFVCPCCFSVKWNSAV